MPHWNTKFTHNKVVYACCYLCWNAIGETLRRLRYETDKKAAIKVAPWLSRIEIQEQNIRMGYLEPIKENGCLL